MRGNRGLRYKAKVDIDYEYKTVVNQGEEFEVLNGHLRSGLLKIRLVERERALIEKMHVSLLAVCKQV
jgi:hypothetical protein